MSYLFLEIGKVHFDFKCSTNQSYNNTSRRHILKSDLDLQCLPMSPKKDELKYNCHNITNLYPVLSKWKEFHTSITS